MKSNDFNCFLLILTINKKIYRGGKDLSNDVSQAYSLPSRNLIKVYPQHFEWQLGACDTLFEGSLHSLYKNVAVSNLL